MTNHTAIENLQQEIADLNEQIEKANAELKKQRKKKLIYCAALVKPIISYSDKQAENIR